MNGRVVWVVDGDTIHVRIGTRLEKVRYIGVNAPEIPHDTRGWREGGGAGPRGQPAARGGAHGAPGTRHPVQGSLGAASGVRRVRRATTLVMINAEMLRRGYAQAITIPPNVKYQERFLKLQREAREAGRGLWSRG